jgi:hypothetical protein
MRRIRRRRRPGLQNVFPVCLCENLNGELKKTLNDKAVASTSLLNRIVDVITTFKEGGYEGF